MDKSALRAALLRKLEDDLALQTAAALTSRDEATNEESKAEGKYDTRAQEAAYLAEGQARLVAELREALAQYATLPLPACGPSDAIAVGAVVTLTGESRTPAYFLGPRSGGTEFTVEGQTVLIVTPASPLGRQLLGKRRGETVALPGVKRPQVIATVL